VLDQVPDSRGQRDQRPRDEQPALGGLFGRSRQVGELVREAGGVAAVPTEAEAVDVAVAGQPELGGELALVEQAHLLRARPRDRLRRLDLEPAVAPQAGGGRDQLADDDVLLQAEQPVGLALERSVREDLGGLLERGGREERVGRERGLGDAEDDLGVLGLLVLLLLDPGVLTQELVTVDQLPREVARRAALLDPDLLHHLPDDDLDVLVVDVDALRLVDLLHLLHEVHLGLGAAAGVQELGRVDRALVELLAHLDLGAGLHEQARTDRERVGVLLA
jgi:hypothetical protein